MKRNKKGFTLIELLAVIVILAVIALIAVPVVMNIVNKANKSAFKDTAYGIISAGELYFAEQQLKVDGMSGEKTFDLSKDVNTEDGLQIKGEVPNGTLKVNEKGETALAITNGRYCITKKYSDKDITVTEDLTNCNIPEEPKKLVQVVPDDNGGISGDGSSTGESTRPSCVTDETQCAAGTALAIQVNGSDTYKFYVLNDDGEKVTLIMAEDLGDDVYWNENPEVCVSFSEDYNEDGEIKEEDGEVGEECYPTSTSGPLTALEA